MSAHLPGNPHADGPVNYMAEMHAGGRSDQAMVASAMLALAYEQRTANLIAFYGYGDIVELDTITERLGL